MLATHNHYQILYLLRRAQVPFGFRFEWELRCSPLPAFALSVVILEFSAPALNADPKETACVNHTVDRNQLSYAARLSTVIQDRLWLGSKRGFPIQGRKEDCPPPSAHHPLVQFILSHLHSTDGNLTDARMSPSEHCNPFGNSERISSIIPALRSILQKSWQVLTAHVQPNGFLECGRSVLISFLTDGYIVSDSGSSISRRVNHITQPSSMGD